MKQFITLSLLFLPIALMAQNTPVNDSATMRRLAAMSDPRPKMPDELPANGTNKLTPEAFGRQKTLLRRLAAMRIAPANNNYNMNLFPAEGAVLTKAETANPVIFKWQSISSDSMDVTYRISIRDIKSGQERSQALTNKPLVVLDTKKPENTSIALPKTKNSMLWNVECFIVEEPGGKLKSLGKSEATQFKVL